MTDQSPNDQFCASSFLQGHRANQFKLFFVRDARHPVVVGELSGWGDGEETWFWLRPMNARKRKRN